MALKEPKSAQKRPKVPKSCCMTIDADAEADRLARLIVELKVSAIIIKNAMLQRVKNLF